MTVLFAHNTADLYGASRSLLRLSTRLQADGHSVIVLLPCSGPLQNELGGAGVKVVIDRHLAHIDRKIANPLAILKLAIKLAVSVLGILRLICRDRVDLMHTNTSLILSPGIAARISGTPHVWHIREFFSEFPALWRVHQHLMSRCADAIVAVSSAVAAQFDEPIRQRKVAVIHNGFPLAEFEHVSRERTDSFRRQFGLNGDLSVGLIGRVKLRRKGQDVFVKAVARLQERFPAARFLLIGSPFPGNEEHLAMLERLIEDEGVVERITYTGDVRDIKAAISALDVTVLPTALPEPFGGAVIESMAMGKPVIGTRIGGTVEQIDDGVTGLLIEPDNPEELARAIERLLSDADLRTRMGQEARRRFRQSFEFEPFYRKILQLYARVACVSNTHSGHRNAEDLHHRACSRT